MNDSLLEARYTVDPAERVRTLLGRDEIPETAELSYSFSQGYERLEYRDSEQSGGLSYQGSFHPGDGCCVGPHVCSYCGRTLFDGE